MLFNRIIKDIIDWVWRLLHWKRHKVSKKPYSIIEIYTCDYGVLKLVERDTIRAVWTYVFSPKNYSSTNIIKEIFDYHICLDHLYAVRLDKLENNSNALKRLNKKDILSKLETTYAHTLSPRHPVDTHAITILKANKWIDSTGNYKTDVVYHNTFNFIGTDSTGYRDKYALPIFKDVVFQLKTKLFDEVSWESELVKAQKRFMGSYYVDTSSKEIDK